VDANGVEVEKRVGIAERVNVGTAVGFVGLTLEQAVRTSIKKSRRATMGFFTRPSLGKFLSIVTDCNPMLIKETKDG
jgi:hypothetical protein